MTELDFNKLVLEHHTGKGAEDRATCIAYGNSVAIRLDRSFMRVSPIIGHMGKLWLHFNYRSYEVHPDILVKLLDLACGDHDRMLVRAAMADAVL